MGCCICIKLTIMDKLSNIIREILINLYDFITIVIILEHSILIETESQKGFAKEIYWEASSYRKFITK